MNKFNDKEKKNKAPLEKEIVYERHWGPEQQAAFGELSMLQYFSLAKFEERSAKKGYFQGAKNGGISEICKS